MKRYSKLLFVVSLHFALFALIAKPVEPSGATATVLFGGGSVLLLFVGVFYEVGVGGSR